MLRKAPEVQALLSQADQKALDQHRKISMRDIFAAVLESKNEACQKFVAAGIDMERMLRE
jgi:hemoglobin-like flavoprotein